MLKQIRRVLLATALIAGAAVTSATTAPAQGELPSVLHLSLNTEGSSVQRTTLLECHPAGGAHKFAQKACTDLELVQGDFRQMRVNLARACTLEYLPVTAKLEGKWRGDVVSYTKSYPNTCAMQNETGVLFDL
ncbi:Subtilisin inhibitor-like [Saccharopolyspora kobensis]|uniref:Subtilisin inhibitor-like n=1 Tax=Saccharopolyspora kobensis TaxID=146035 RepID=A0A1H6EGJ8_9PSEU|nr:SSI family serine proteinase inhibitor [Saccharopolyspora kobensis]SEG96403.1 Subtilisin inhibitor-like [Saccharopolyspora kobensis]SFD19617.1 Subtilisin inhibitor-like [Saccharopolyspora kobensis]